MAVGGEVGRSARMKKRLVSLSEGSQQSQKSNYAEDRAYDAQFECPEGGVGSFFGRNSSAATERTDQRYRGLGPAIASIGLFYGVSSKRIRADVSLIISAISAGLLLLLGLAVCPYLVRHSRRGRSK